MIAGPGDCGRRRMALMKPRLHFIGPMHSYLANSAGSLPRVGLRFEASSFSPCRYSVFRKSGGAVGDILRCGEPDLPQRVRCFLEKRFGKSKVQEKSFVRVGMELAQETDLSVTLTQEDFAKKLNSHPTSPALRAGRREPSALDETKMRQCTSDELWRVARVPKPDIYARSARIASRIN